MRNFLAFLVTIILTVAFGCSQPSVRDAIIEDTAPTIETGNPDAVETADTAIDVNIWCYDGDDDGYGDPSDQVVAEFASNHYVADCTDCDDNDPAINSDASEICDLVDNNCDGQIDEGAQTTWYRDADGDGFGDVNVTTAACTVPTGYVSDTTDCNDADPRLNPGSAELCDGLDNDCNGSTDDNATDMAVWYADVDMDSYGDANSFTQVCTQPDSFVSDSTDCDDASNAVNPGATEYCNGHDDNCDGTTDEPDSADVTIWYIDSDGDGFGVTSQVAFACNSPLGYSNLGNDCNDSDLAVNPDVIEICNGTDDNCDGVTDEGVKLTWYRDADNDSFGNSADTFVSCDAPSGYVSDATDCDDAEAIVYPGADELCNDVDDNCDGNIDESAVDTIAWYYDADEDGYGRSTSGIVACNQPMNYVVDATDCDDTRSDIHPDANEADCTDMIDYNCDGSVGYADVDGDGQAACEDCNDVDVNIYPGAPEYCNEIDDDCDGTVDENEALDATTWYRDADLDGFGNPLISVQLCQDLDGYVTDSTDCDDTRSSVNPDADEYCNSTDDNCDGVVDENAVDASTWYRDADNDGYGTEDEIQVACLQPLGFELESGDCDDEDNDFYPNAPEDCTDPTDYNCDGSVEYADVDNDGFAACEECNDYNVGVYPGAAEVCDGVDNNCDGVTDRDATDAPTWYADMDNDGYGDTSHSLIYCTQPNGYVANSTDCNDSRADVYPSAPEYCDGFDNDCDGTIDESDAIDASTWYLDPDHDGYGDYHNVTQCGQPSGYVANNGDCDSANNTIYPTALELCDSADNDCDGVVDENAATSVTWYEDQDGDGFGGSTQLVTDCHVPSGNYWSIVGGDCNDTDFYINPVMWEVCDSIDNDCNGTVDDGVQTTYYRDSDHDGYGDVNDSTAACSQPSGYVTNSIDCNDASASSYPSADELCSDNVDNDCDGQINENSAVDATTWFLDVDSDGYGNANSSFRACSVPSGYVGNNTDCSDTNPAIHPSATEYCNGVDDDCDYSVDESSAVDAATRYRDSDGDGYGTTSTTRSCAQSVGYTSMNGDCDDYSTLRHPGAIEVCTDLIDNNCDGSAGGVDADSDGYASCDDCDDGRDDVYPGADEYCDGVDNDCNSVIDEDSALDVVTWFIDQDNDGHGSPLGAWDSCSAPTGYVANADDCNDSLDEVYPRASELCDSLDNDCDGAVDEGLTYRTYYQDADQDGSGGSVTSYTCTQPIGYVTTSTDCNDANDTVYLGATELCDSLDNDCDGATDDNTQSVVWYRDADSDGYGNASYVQTSCVVVSDCVPNNAEDCDDGNADINPAAEESCDGVDNDCNSLTDEASSLDASIWYLDVDNDSYGMYAVYGCEAPSSSYSEDGGDCNDGSQTSYPGASELCDSIDNDCDGVVDEGCPLP